MTNTHITAPTEIAEANGVRFAFRRFGNSDGVPLLFMPHYRAGMDHWDPAVTDGFARSRPVILFDNAGVSGSSGETPDTMEAMADRAADFISALGLSKVDVSRPLDRRLHRANTRSPPTGDRQTAYPCWHRAAGRRTVKGSKG